jgi:hypothetical protein
LEHFTCLFVEGEHSEGLRRREWSFGLIELTARESGEFMLDRLYSMWFLGIILYEVAARRPHFDRKVLPEVTKLLCDKGFKVDVGAVLNKKPW